MLWTLVGFIFSFYFDKVTELSCEEKHGLMKRKECKK
jgi:hypothetical protein